jgi:hypothetical protein
MIYQFKDGQDRPNVVSCGKSRGPELVYGLPPQVIVDDASSIVSSIHEDDVQHFQEV